MIPAQNFKTNLDRGTVKPLDESKLTPKTLRIYYHRQMQRWEVSKQRPQRTGNSKYQHQVSSTKYLASISIIKYQLSIFKYHLSMIKYQLSNIKFKLSNTHNGSVFEREIKKFIMKEVVGNPSTVQFFS